MPEHTIAENLTRLQNAKTAIGNAITTRGGTVAASDGLEEFAADIATIPSGGGGGSTGKSDVNFYDYDGTIVNSYTAAEFAELTAMPNNPTHEGFTAQGWNWSLSDAKKYVASYGKLNVGQTYITSDGKTRLYIDLLDDYKSPTLELYLNANSEVDIDWGDGSSHSTLSSTSAGYQSETHTYAVSGDYIIAITVVSGSIEIRGNSDSFSLLKGNDSTTNQNYRESLFNIEIGSGVSSIETYAFQYCYSLASITIPASVTSIAERAFRYCSSLTSITIPASVTSIGFGAFQDCYSLTSITIPAITSIGSAAFSNCYSLTSITIPAITSIENGAFNNCYSLTSITIPASVTSIINYAFSNCYSLTSITIPAITSIGSNAFNNCYSLLYINYLGTDLPTGSPWGAPNTHIKVRILRHNNYTSAVKEVTGTTLNTSVSCTVGDLVVATFVIRGNTYSLSEGWTLIGISEVVGTYNQRTGLAYKIATNTTESLVVTQNSSARIYTNLVAITGASIGTFSGFTTQSTGSSITMVRPNGLVLWAVSSSLWGTQSPFQPWEISNAAEITAIELPTTTQPRCLTALDQSNDSTVTFRYSPGMTEDGALAAASLTITGIDNFWYYDEPT